MSENIELLDYLRQQTRSDHRALDGQPELRQLAKDPSLDEYVGILVKLGVAFRAAEHCLAERPVALNLPGYLCRDGAIQSDLDKLLRAAPCCRPAQLELRSPFALVGARYVLDGSSQGARILWSRLRTHLPQLESMDAHRYWQVQENAGERWGALCRSLNCTVEPTHADEAVLGAKATFGLFRACFEGEV